MGLENEGGIEKFITTNLEDLFARLDDAKRSKGTLWFGISGSWRKTSADIESEVRAAVRKVLDRGDGIVSGGALNVDSFAVDEAFLASKDAKRIKVFLPVTFDLYAAHYRKRAEEGVITSEQAESLISQLEKIRLANPEAIIENPHNTVVDPKTYFERNTEVVKASDALVAFQVNKSEGVGDTVEKALQAGKPVCIQEYKIE